jgi:hypothetical protein
MAALTREDFHEAQPSELNLSSVPPSQTAIEKNFYQEVRSTSHVLPHLPTEFIITGQNGMEFLDLKRSKLYVKCKILRSDGTPLDETDEVAPVNLLFHSMFSQVDVMMQGKLIVSTSNHYPFKSMIQTLLTYGSDAKTSQLTSQMWLKDTPGHMDDYEISSTANAALPRRAEYFSGSKTVDMEGPILHDLFQLDRYLLNQVAVSVKLYRTRPEFCLMAKNDAIGYEVVIEDIVLKACKVQVNPAVIFAQAEILRDVNAKYVFTRTEMKLLTIPAGNMSFTYDNLFQGLRPNRLCVGFINAEAGTGNYHLNPYNFRHFNLTQIGLFVDSVPVGGNVMKLNFNAKSGRTIIPAYNNMFEITGKSMRDADNQIDRNYFAGGYALYCFEIEPNFGNEGNYITLVKQGNVRLEAQFAKPLKKATTCILYAEFPGYFEINAARDIILE